MKVMKRDFYAENFCKSFIVVIFPSLYSSLHESEKYTPHCINFDNARKQNL